MRTAQAGETSLSCRVARLSPNRCISHGVVVAGREPRPQRTSHNSAAQFQVGSVQHGRVCGMELSLAGSSIKGKPIYAS